MRSTPVLSALFLALALGAPALAAKRKSRPEVAPPPPPVEVVDEVEEPPAPVDAAPVVAPEPAPAEVGLPGAPSGAAAVFAVPRSPATAERAGAIEVELIGHLNALGVKIVDLSAAFPPSSPRSIKRGETLFAEGKQAYDNLDLEAAKTKFAEALAFLLEHANESSPEKIAQIFTYLGSAAIMDNDLESAKEAFRNAAAVAPDAPPDPELFPSEVMEGYGAAWEWVAQQKAGTVQITSTPPGATVLIAGERLGKTPLEVQRPYGRIRVHFERPGYEPAAVYADQKGTGVKAHAELVSSPGLSATREMAESLTSGAVFGSKELPPEAQAIAERVSARYLVLAAVEEGDAEVEAWDLTSSTKLQRLRVSDGGTSEVARKIDAWTRGELRTEEENGLFSKLPEVMKRPWFWAAVGGVAAASAGAVWVGTSSSGGRPFNVVTGIP